MDRQPPKALWYVLLALAVLVAVLAVVATGTGSGPTSASKDEPSASPAVTAEKEPAPHGAYRLSDTAKLDNGISVTLSDFSRGVSSDTASPDNEDYLRYRVLVKNESDQKLDLGLFLDECLYGKPGTPSETVFDSAKGLDGAPSVTLLPGDTARFPVACTVPPTEDYIRIEITADWSEDPAIFAGRVG
jgi:hypothetical protein